MLKRKVTLTHKYTSTETVDIDATSDVVDMSISKEERCANECTFKLYDRNGTKYKGRISKEDDLKVYVNETLEFDGLVMSKPYVHSDEGNYYNITAYTDDIKLGFADTGNRVISTKYGHEIITGWAGDVAFAQDIITTGVLTFQSSDAGDTQNVVIIGKNGVFTINETLKLTGTGAVNSVNTYTDILYCELASAATGNISIKDAGANVLGTITAGNSNITFQDGDSNYSNGVGYDLGFTFSFSAPMDYQIAYFPIYNEAPEITLERICDIGDSNGMWTWTFNSSTSTINVFPRSTTNNDYDFGDINIEFEDTESTKNSIILKCAKAKTADATLQEIVGYASTDDGLLTKIQVFSDTSISEQADATQKAESILEELSTTEKIGTASLPLKMDVDLYDRIYVYDLNDDTWGYEIVFGATHDIDAEVSQFNVGHKIFSINTVETLSGFDNVARYGDIGTELPDRIFYQTSFDFNIASSYPVTVNLNVPEEGIYKAYLHLKGEKFRQASAEAHTHDNSASYSLDAQTHGYGTQKDTAQIHSVTVVYTVDAYTSSGHVHGISGNTGAGAAHTHTLNMDSTSFAGTLHTHDISSSGTHNHGDPYSPIATGVHTHTTGNGSAGHQHTVSGSAVNESTHTHAISFNSAQVTGGYIKNAVDAITSAFNTGSSAAELDAGSTGSSGGTISGSSGSRTVGPTMAEDTYPNAVTITINGVDRTGALGGPWSDNFDLTGDNKLDITSYVNTDGEHTIAFASTRNGRIVGHINVYY